MEKVREDEDETVGYKLDFSMLHNTYISLDDQVYDEFYNRYSDEYYTDIFDECYTIAEVVQRFTVGASLTLEADFVKHILDWSTLFSVQELPTIFQIRILEAVHGLITINVSMNIDLAGGIGALDLIVEMVNEDNEKILSFYLVTGYITMGEINPSVYIESSLLGIPKLKLDIPSASNFLNISQDLIRNLLIRTDEVSQQMGMPRAIQNSDDPNYDDEDGLQFMGINLGGLFESLSIGKGTLAIVLMPSAIASIISDLFNLPLTKWAT